MNKKFLKNVDLIVENKKIPSISILLEKKKKKKGEFPDDPFQEKKKDKVGDEEEMGDDLGMGDEEETGDDLGMGDDSEDKESEQKIKLDREAKDIERESILKYITGAAESESERNIAMKNLSLENPLNNLAAGKLYKLSTYLFESAAEDEDTDFEKKVDDFIDKNKKKVHKFKVGVEQEKKGYGINVKEEVNNAISSLKNFDKKVFPPDLVRYFYMQRIIDFSDIEKINSNMEDFDDLYYREVKEIPEYADYEREDINISLKNNYNNAAGGKTPAG
jgi:hypothetical protein